MLKVLPARLALVFAIAFAVAAPAESAPDYPAYLPALIQHQAGAHVAYESYGEANVYPGNGNKPVVEMGRHWNAGFALGGLAGVASKTAWTEHLKPAFLASGWTALSEFDQNPFSTTLHYQKDGKEAWARLSIFSPGDIRMDVIEAAGQPMVLNLNAPAATPEVIAPKTGDIPYLAPLPGAKFQAGSRSDAPLMVKLPGASQPEIVGTDTLRRDYAGPLDLSALQFASVYHDALTAAGWTILIQNQAISQSDAAITAHYARNGRDIWAYLHGTPAGFSLVVADAGADDLSQKLAKQCHVALYGILFDFNKATLKPESDSVLQRVLGALNKTPSLSLAIEGHTDNVGGEAYNQKLSEARAKSVLDWLAQHGIAAARLRSAGYGLTRPIADNTSDVGRARNRRVEISKPGCGVK